MIDGQMLPAVTVACMPAIGDDGGLLVDVSLDYVNESADVTFAFRTNSQKHVLCLAENYHPLTINQASFIISFTEFAFVDFNVKPGRIAY